MPYRFRDHYLAAAGLGAIILSLLVTAVLWSNGAFVEQQSRAAYYCSQYQLEERQARRSVNESSIGGAADPSGEQADRDYQQHTAWCDLAAQQEMADATLGMEKAAWGTVLLTLVGVVLLSITVVHTGRTLDEAKATSASARESVEVARKTLSAMERPWITVDLEINNPLYCRKHEVDIPILISVKNIGRSPAGSIKIFAKALPFMNYIEETFDGLLTDAVEKMRQTAGVTLFPGKLFERDEYLRISQDVLLPEIKRQVDFWPDDEIQPIIVGVVCYFSPYDDIIHSTPFAYALFETSGEGSVYQGVRLRDGPIPEDMTIARINIARNAT